MFRSRQNKIKNSGFRGIVIILLFLSLSLLAPRPAQAMIPVADIPGKIWSALKFAWDKAGSIALQEATRQALNKLAYDAATRLATGARGQKPLYIKENWQEFLGNAADNVAGTMIESLGQNNGFKDFNLCEPKLDVRMNIGLGLIDQTRPREPDCTWTEMKNNWNNEYDRLKAMSEPGFLKIFQKSFDPRGNDLGIALSLQTELIERQQAKIDEENLLTAFQGLFRDPTDASGSQTGVPGDAQKALDATRNKLYSVVGNFTGSALIDASKVFLNQLAVATFNKKLQNLGQSISKSSSPYDFEGIFGGGGISGAREYLREIVEPKFDTRGDYDIIASLSSCTKLGGYAATNECVIDQNFANAIREKKTVGEAMQQGLLDPNKAFGFRATGNTPIEPDYNQGYPYRSMLILRKYRIIPVSWEELAQKIKTDQDWIKDATLGNMVACFDPCDSYKGFEDGPVEDGACVNPVEEAWCKGYVDPNWVLKAPQNYCAKEGYGPEIINEEIIETENEIKQRSVFRNDNYCADEQSCIKEQSDGSCNLYGYCTAERRIWNFDAQECEPKYNTCQTFKSASNGSSQSYLTNTLEYCSTENSGCKEYAQPISYNNNSVTWGSEESNKSYFNKEATTCNASDEGCTELVRIIPKPGISLAEIEAEGVSVSDEKVDQKTIYEKILPSYLEDICGANPDEQICVNYAKQCGEEEAGCKFYTSSTRGFSVPAKVEPEDYCSSECVGYNTYVQAETAFEETKDQYFIPSTADSCGAAASGCDEFTNLDNLTQGGEQREYYNYLRQCIKPGAAGANCGEFYTWEGSDESGYQLRVFNLQKDNDGDDGTLPNPEARYVSDPAVITYDYSECNKEIYNLDPADPAYNSDCREFYNREGEISYHLYEQTIACSEDCHPYRRNASDDTAGNCTAHNGDWQNNACVYLAIPSESRKCSANSSGCRKYSGNQGNNIQIIANYDFESGNTEGWLGDVSPSSESIRVGGGSLAVSTAMAQPAMTPISQAVQGMSYSLSFLAKADGNTSLDIYFSNGEVGENISFNLVDVEAGNWQIYEANLSSLDHSISTSEKLVIVADTENTFYIDDIRLTAIIDRYYLIKDSWQTPDKCYEDIDGDFVGPFYNLGCDEYRDNEDKAYYLHSFSQLCQDSAAGCELMIDTKNSSVPDDDEFIYAVYDKDKLCNSRDKGCELLGLPYTYDGDTLYSNVYLRNDPNRYDEILCEASEAGCEEWTYAINGATASKFFKDPGDMVCEWRQEKNSNSWGWYKKYVKRCTGAGNVCLSDTNCSTGQTCVLNEIDEICDIDDSIPPKTIGYGGAGNRVAQPINNWAGICSSSQSGCSEYIDPISKSANNLVDGTQVELIPNTLYILSGVGSRISCGATLNKLNNDNYFSDAVSVVNGPAIFFNFSSSLEDCMVSSGELRKAIVDYRLKQEVDTASCNGLVDFEQGCVLLNERLPNGAGGLADLIYDANLTIDDGNGIIPVAGQNNANKLAKVRPDRVCSEWLACRSYIKNADDESVCFDVSLCDSLDDSGNCDNFVVNNEDNSNNLVGYSRANHDLSVIDQVGGVVELANGGFEMAGGNGYPVGWSNTSDSVWNANRFKVLADAAEITAELGQGNYPPEGNNILKLGPKASLASENIDLDIDDIVSVYINTNKLSSDNVTIKFNDTINDTILATVSPGFNGYKVIKSPISDRGKLIFSSSSEGGYAYFDDIKIKPALDMGENPYVIQSCQLYPQQDSLACNYIDNSGIRQKGLIGYCLEYDRYPGLSDSCLLWYPIDKVKGEGIEEGAGYKDKYPLYYCTETQGKTRAEISTKVDDFLELRFAKNEEWYGGEGTLLPGDGQPAIYDSGGDESKVAQMDPGEYVVLVHAWDRQTSKVATQAWWFSTDIKVGDVRITTGSNNDWKCIYSGQEDDEWFDVKDGSLPGILKYNYDYPTVEDDGKEYNWKEPELKYTTSDPEVFWVWLAEAPRQSHIICRTTLEVPTICGEFIQTVSAAGDNKVYQSRMSGGDDNFFISINNGIGTGRYNSDSPPFGTITYPEPAANPYEWDTSEIEGIQPLFYSRNEDIARMGQLHNDNDLTKNDYEGDLKKLFAQSYGGYILSYGKCQESINGEDDGAECFTHQNCPGSICTAIPGDSIYQCDVNSGNSLDTCDPDASCGPEDCLYAGDAYRCDGVAEGALCCALPTSCQGGTCSDGANCDIPDGQEPIGCASTFKYKCNSTTTAGDPDSGDNCCGSGGSCSTVCGNESTRAGLECIDETECPIPIKKCKDGEKDGDVCENDNDCIVKRCGTGEHSGDICDKDVDCTDSDTNCLGICDGSPVHCIGDSNCPENQFCGQWKCEGGLNDGNSCDPDRNHEDCPGDEHDCDPTEPSTCEVSGPPSFDTCELTKCIGGPNSGTMNCGLTGCDAGDICIEVWRDSSDNRCCSAGPGGPDPLCVEGATISYTYECVGGAEDVEGNTCEPSEVGFCSMGVCEGSGRYIMNTLFNDWNPPTDSCYEVGNNDGIRDSEEICYIKPEILEDIKVNGAENVIINKNGFVNLTFNTKVDKEQLPLVEYEVDWGDGSKTTVTGAEMNHRPNTDNPHEVYHLYSYWNAVEEEKCTAPSDCDLDITIRIKDNWGKIDQATASGIVTITK